MTLTLSWVFRVLLSLLIGLAVAFAFRQEWRYEQQVAQTSCTAREGKNETPWSGSPPGSSPSSSLFCGCPASCLPVLLSAPPF